MFKDGLSLGGSLFPAWEPGLEWHAATLGLTSGQASSVEGVHATQAWPQQQGPWRLGFLCGEADSASESKLPEK